MSQSPNSLTPKNLKMSQSTKSRPHRKIKPPARFRNRKEAATDSSPSPVNASPLLNSRHETTNAILQTRALPSAAFPSLPWPPELQKVDTHLMEKQDSCNPGLDASGPQDSFEWKSKHTKIRGDRVKIPLLQNSPSKQSLSPRETKYPGDGLAGHGIPLILDLRAQDGFDWRTIRRKKRAAERQAKYEKFMTIEARQEERRYRAFLAAETSKVKLYGPAAAQVLLCRPNIYRSPRDRFCFEEDMATSSEEEDKSARKNEGLHFKWLHIVLQCAIILEIEEDVADLIHNCFPANSKHYASCTLLHITNSYIEGIMTEKSRLVAEDDREKILVRDKDIAEARTFLEANDLPLSLIALYDPNQN